ncbi:sulfotransferase family protein [Aurantiacibacter luteus]|uniref:Nodulation protein NoeE n=1 Tax=Aurantiacibacter luteus TaxID=1581420 RepID=A0A0G9N310_9SPHN|nr:sulfotransferase [Aurantiacibacter luteus]KLE35933.1 nodulation protein NoeE [Aurantiacibacter luteus]
MIPHRYVFVAGLHRSGTSLVAQLLAQHPAIAAITGAPVPENEGCYLQGAIPHTARHGIPGHFATDPAQHHVEGCALDMLATRERLEADWNPWFPAGAAWRVEKSPVNLTRMRLLQSLYPLAQFVVVTRHPAFVDLAMRKWGIGPEDAFSGHWRAAHDTVMEDLTYLHAAMVLRYEDLVSDPECHVAALWAFLGLDPVAPDVAHVRDGNVRYREDAASHDAAYEALGYATGGRTESSPPIVRHPLRQVREATLAALASPP